MLASASSFSSSGARVHHSPSRWAVMSASSAELEALSGERVAVDAGGQGRVDAVQRVFEAGAEGPACVAVLVSLGQG